jgi:type IV pilus assembly protein PilY1
VLQTLVCGSGATLRLNAGTMLFNPNGTADGNSVMSGYLRQRVAPMDATRCAEMLADLANIDAKITTPDFKGPSSAEYGAPLYEAFKYFGGYARASASGSGTLLADATHYGPVRYSRPIDLEDPLAFRDPPPRRPTPARAAAAAAARTTSSSSATPGRTRSTAPTPMPCPTRPTC